MRVLAIETSCDETAVAVVEKTSMDSELVTVHSNVVASSLKLHEETGGIVPEIAAREQMKAMMPVLHKALTDAAISANNIDALAVTEGPGLIGSLLVGVETAKALSLVLAKPLIPVNHVLAHVYANFIAGAGAEIPQFPALALIVSGGHTELVMMQSHTELLRLGSTRDDAAGECFDKCARLLGFPYPGGPKISALAATYEPRIQNGFTLPKPQIDTQTLDMSFSGLKTAFLNLVRKMGQKQENGYGYNLDESIKIELSYQLEHVITEVLVNKTRFAVERYSPRSVLLAGGVAANSTLREKLKASLAELSVPLYIPPLFLCTDNAAVIGAAALYRPLPKPLMEIQADPSLDFI